MLRLPNALALAALCLLPATALAQPGARVLVVANESAPDSVKVAERYMAARSVPDSQLIRVTTATSEEIDRAVFDQTIQAPVAQWLARHAAHDRILYIVLTRGMPLRIRGTPGRQGTIASVDSELALLYRRMTGVTVPINGPVPNPYYAGEGDPAGARPFTHAEYDIFLVTRLDGFTTDDALGLVERGTAPVKVERGTAPVKVERGTAPVKVERGTAPVKVERGAAPAKSGVVVLDAPSDMADPRNTWLTSAAERLTAAGHQVTHDTTSRVIQGVDQVIGYFSWGSNDPAFRQRVPKLTFAPGAVGGMFLSSDARTFAEPPAQWVPGQTTPQAMYAGSRQSLIGDLIRAGITGVSGAVAEPFTDGAVRPDILFPAYLGGATLGEAFYRALPHVGWQMVVVGDPLASPFGSGTLTDEGEAEIDPDTELPAHFSARRAKALAAALKAPEPAVKWLLRAEARTARDDKQGSIEALERAVEAHPEFLAAWQRLGLDLEAAGRHADANAAYRRIIELDRNNVIALNNLAYSLAVREKQPEEALGLAQRAVTLSKGNPTVVDTLAWIHYLLGNTQDALRLIEPAAKALPNSAEVQFHAAVILAAVGRLEEAGRALDAAVKLDAGIRDRAEYPDVVRKIGRE